MGEGGARGPRKAEPTECDDRRQGYGLGLDYEDILSAQPSRGGGHVLGSAYPAASSGKTPMVPLLCSQPCRSAGAARSLCSQVRLEY